MGHGIVPDVGRATYADLLAVPEHLVAEIVGGELITSPRPAPPHALAGSAIGSALFDRFNGPPGGSDRPGGWWILFEPELHLSDDVLVPDVAGWRRTRLPTLPAETYFTVAPDWVCEIVSPSSGRLDRTRKMPIYARAGVAFLWMVDPGLRTLEAYRLDGSRWMVAATAGGGDAVCVAPFDALAIDMSRWWPD